MGGGCEGAVFLLLLGADRVRFHRNGQDVQGSRSSPSACQPPLHPRAPHSACRSSRTTSRPSSKTPQSLLTHVSISAFPSPPHLGLLRAASHPSASSPLAL
eukprot:755798-Hanusia_phi.AAC.4